METDMAKRAEVRWTVFKDYYRGDTNFTDSWVILYGTQAEAEAAKANLEAGQDKSWFDTAGDEEQAFLYVDQITL